jgi:hypothetical protein
MISEKTSEAYKILAWARERVCIAVGESISYYTAWGSAVAFQNIQNEFQDIQRNCVYNFSELSRDEAIDLGFGLWESERPYYLLIPIWIVSFLPEEIPTKTVNGETSIKRDDMDLDHRYGLLAYGVEFEK